LFRDYSLQRYNGYDNIFISSEAIAKVHYSFTLALSHQGRG
jgi:hypothetical protein